MQAKAILVVLNFILSYLRKHPAVVDKVLAEVAKDIPGEIDDVVIRYLRKLLSI